MDTTMRAVEGGVARNPEDISLRNALVLSTLEPASDDEPRFDQDSIHFSQSPSPQRSPTQLRGGRGNGRGDGQSPPSRQRSRMSGRVTEARPAWNQEPAPDTTRPSPIRRTKFASPFWGVHDGRGESRGPGDSRRAATRMGDSSVGHAVRGPTRQVRVRVRARVFPVFCKRDGRFNKASPRSPQWSPACSTLFPPLTSPHLTSSPVPSFPVSHPDPFPPSSDVPAKCSLPLIPTIP